MKEEGPKLEYGREGRRSRPKSVLRAYAEVLGLLLAIFLLACLLACLLSREPL